MNHQEGGLLHRVAHASAPGGVQLLPRVEKEHVGCFSAISAHHDLVAHSHLADG